MNGAQGRIRVFGIAAVCAGSLLGATASSAGAVFMLTPQVDFAADPITVGSSGTGTLSFTNDSTAGEDADDIERIVLEPSCRNPGETPPCSDREPNIFSIGTGTGAIGTACQGITFNPTAGALPFTGSVELTAQTAIPDMPVNATCVITFSYTALGVPTVDTQGQAGTQTDQLALVRGDDGGGPVGFGPGTGDTTINPFVAPPAPPATPVPTPAATGQRAAALTKCKKKRSKKAKRKCRAKANLLPV